MIEREKIMHETENQTRLRRAKEALATCQDAENEARKVLAASVESTKHAREKLSEIFAAEEKLECARRLNDYSHCTK